MRPRLVALLALTAFAGPVAPAALAAPGSDKPAAAKPGASEPDAAKPGAAKPDKPRITRPKPYKPVPGVTPPRPLVGFADQKPSMFADQRFQDLKIRHARINVPWDVLQDPNTLPNVDAWMAGAKLGNVKPLITVDRSRRRGMQSRNPTAGVMATQVRKWRARWSGQVRQISSWNEGNINKRPELVAQWYLAIRKACQGCVVLGADLVDRKNAVSWAERFIVAAKRVPRAWGFHNYVDSNNFKVTNTRKFLRAIPGKLWLTETGGVLRRARPSVRFSGTGAAHAAKATDFLFKKIVPVDPVRIQRVYLYSWSTAPNDLTWDSGVVGPDGSERPALQILRCYLGNCKSKTPAEKVPVPPAADGGGQPMG